MRSVRLLRRFHWLSHNRMCNDGSPRYMTSLNSPSINVDKSDVMVDEKVKIMIEGLQDNQRVSLLSTLRENNKLFASCGHYVADDKGTVDTTVLASHGGSFTGVQPLGLFTSVKEVFGSSRMMKRDVTTPYDVTLSVHDGHTDFEALAREFVASRVRALAVTSLRRWYKAPGVRRIPVREGRLRGVLLLPPGDGPFPGIVDVFGLAGGVFDYRAGLLANRGYAAFHLAYIAYEDLSNDPADINIPYFMEAVDWLSEHPMVRPGGVGMIGHCFGGGLCIATTTFNPRVKVLVATNSNPFIMLPGDHQHNGISIKSLELDLTKFTYTEEGVIQKDAFSMEDVADHLTPIWKSDARVLIQAGEDDLCVDPRWHRLLQAAIPPEKRDNFRFIFYPGAGHLIEPPYSPHCSASYNKIIQVTHLWGGDPERHLPVQEKAWGEIITFLDTHLAGNKSHL